MRATSPLFAVLTMVVLSACSDPNSAFTMTGPLIDPGTPVGEEQTRCLEYQIAMDDPNGTSFTRAAARDDFVNQDCIVRPINTAPAV